MDLAFAAVLIYLIILPGVIARRTYLFGPYSRKYSALAPADEIVASVIPALLLQTAMAYVVRLMGFQLDFGALGALLVDEHSEALVSRAFADVNLDLWKIAAYNVVLWLAAGFLGDKARKFVVAFELDLHFPILRFSNDWYYLLTGREWGLVPGRDYNLVWADVLVGKPAETGIIYSGRLDNFYRSRDGKLESISLKYARKWTSPQAAHPVLIPGAALIIKYEEILNFNLSFYVVNSADEDAIARGAGPVAAPPAPV